MSIPQEQRRPLRKTPAAAVRTTFSEKHIEALRKSGFRKTWPKGTILIREGERAESVIFLEKGLVKTTAQAPNGYTSLLAIRGAGELIGEVSCLDGRRRSATVTAIQDVAGIAITAERFLTLLNSDSELSFAVMRTISTRLRHSDGQRVASGAHTAGIRVARVLLDLVLQYGEPASDWGADVLQVNVTQAELAGAAGTSRESVVRALRELTRRELVATGRKRIVVLNVRKLHAYVT